MAPKACAKVMSLDKKSVNISFQNPFLCYKSYRSKHMGKPKTPPEVPDLGEG